jgi:hypothetical protein
MEMFAVSDASATPTHEKRASKRHPILKGAKITFDRLVIDCLVVSISETGARVRTNFLISVPEKLTLQFNDGATFSAERRWARGLEIGMSLDGPASLSDDDAHAAQQILEMVRAITIEKPTELLRARKCFHDAALQQAAENAKAGLQHLEAILAARIPSNFVK